MNHPERFRATRVLVTGGSRNIGRAIVERFAAEGAHVAINGVVPGEAEDLADELRAAGHTAVPVPADVSDANQVDQMLTLVCAELGGIDVLINNAAVPLLGRVPFFDLTLAQWDRQFDVGARGTYLCTHAAAQRMGPGGNVINISSVGATKAHRSAVAYDASKGAIEAFTRAAALELATHGIRVNAIAPGAISNARFQALEASVQEREVAPIPLGYAGSGDDVAGVAAFLASTDAAYITGQVITVDGGLSAQARQASSEIEIDSTTDGAA
ncbi:SDR family NAD(P)-dependent oxidoreductase [Occultella aeris]|uniref:3-oxoacyl-[acyl-carrier-protein] reductase FabG n=1 Tax=Occultella aeris TaxID=2761496 RepID=A0A7M4DGB5_9MICO|nr:SDR family NAD(P)-dependent oxidoreductase [Occultella aeris]VZO35958.1 3-oxoacyl-[acyl-carrier-protein] reductase FabG [Occultella aeris]